MFFLAAEEKSPIPKCKIDDVCLVKAVVHQDGDLGNLHDHVDVDVNASDDDFAIY